MAHIILNVLLYSLFLFETDVVAMTEYQLPLDDCRTGDIDLLLVSSPWDDTALQVRRFKNIVRQFFPASENEPMRLRLHLKVQVNWTHSESLIHFDDYNTTDGLTEGLDQLTEGLDRLLKFQHFTFDRDRFPCLPNADTIFESSSRINVKRLAILLIPFRQYSCRLKTRIFYSFYVYFIIFMSGSTYSKKTYVQYISGRDDLQSNQEFSTSLCGECKKGWLTFRKSSSRSKLSCFFIKKSDNNISGREAKSFCESKKAKLVSFETKQELNFLQTYLDNIEEAGTRLKGYFVHIGLAQRKLGKVYGLVWDNNLPLTFTFPMVVTNSWSDSSVKHVAWSNKGGPRHDNVTSFSVTFRGKLTHYVICEFEQFYPLLNKDRIVEIQHARDKDYFKILRHSAFYLYGNRVLKSQNTLYYNKDKPRYRYMCDKNEYVLYSLVCNGHKECSNGRDEEICAKYSTISGYQLPCQLRIGFSPKHYYSVEQRCDGQSDCPGGQDEKGCSDSCLETLCEDGTCLPSQWFSNSSSVCRLTQADNGELAAILNLTHGKNSSELSGDRPTVYTQALDDRLVYCGDKDENTNSIRNVLGTRTLAPRCVHLRGKYNSKLGCSDLSHLEDCDNFNCSEGLYKCPNSYCIPLYNINDGYPDCPYGEDEDIYIIAENMFECMSDDEYRTVYVLPVHVCDNKTHCPRGDDELDCHVVCPEGFHCEGGAVNPAIHPDKIHITSLSEFDKNTKFFNLSGIDLFKISPASRGNLNALVELHASNCNLSSAKNIFFNPDQKAQVYLMDLSFNNIRHITHNNVLYLTSNLRVFNLSHNRELNRIDALEDKYSQIRTLDLSYTNITYFACVMRELQELNLSHTRVHVFHFKSSSKIPHLLVTLDVRSTELKINENTVSALALISVTSGFYVDNFQMCCPKVRGPGIPGDFCYAPSDAISSCDDLLGDQFKRVLLWILGVVSVVGNLTVIGFRLAYERKVITKSYRLFVISLSVSDMIMGVYLLIIAGNDLYYRDDYIMHESEWRHSSLCTAAGFLATLSCETSALFVLLVTLERFLVIRFPLGPYRIKRAQKYFLLLLTWVVGLGLAVIPLLHPDWAVYSSNGMCLGLPMMKDQESGWAYSFGVFLVFNCILFILIAMGQLAIFQSMSREKTQLHTGAQSLAQRRREIMVAKNLSLVVVSNFLCWFPICVIGLMTARGHTYSQQTYGWLAVFVLPLNSAVNPVIYTLPVVYKRWEDFKKGNTGNSKKTPVTSI